MAVSVIHPLFIVKLCISFPSSDNKYEINPLNNSNIVFKFLVISSDSYDSCIMVSPDT